MARLPAFAVDGAQVTGRLLRTVAYAATSGQDGIVTPESMKVVANGAGVRIAPGAAVAPTRYVASPAFGSYVMAADAAEDLAIPATGSGGGATRYIIARVDDPEYGGQGDPTGTYWRYLMVSSITNLAYPFVPLARINQPASTTTITDAMIVDLRQVATPRRRRLTYDVAVTTAVNLTSPTYTDFPSGGGLDALVPIPYWATQMIVRVDLLDVLHSVGATDGGLLLRLGSVDGAQARRFDEIWSGSTTRKDYTIVDTIDIPAPLRGTTASLRTRGRRNAGAGYLRMDANSQVVYDVDMIEAPA